MSSKTLLLLIVTLFSCTAIFCQDKKDTIYFDGDWSICEKPVAEYYRVCELNTDSNFFYKGEVKDYYINGQLKTTGDYGQGNNKNGQFIFYNKKGTVIKKGDYLDNAMMGDWYFYDSLGNLRSQFFCKTDLDFTPIFLIDDNNDTLIRNGNGNFIFNNVTQCPYVLSKFNCLIKGTVQNSVKNGEVKYYTYPQEKLLYTEKYENGRFVKSKWDDSYTNGWTNDRTFMLSLSDVNLEKTDAFYHSNMVFGLGDQGTQKLINFLRYNIPPTIPAPTYNFESDKICFNIIFKVLVDEFMQDSTDVIVNDTEDGNRSERLSTASLTEKELNNQRKLNGHIMLTVDTLGQVLDCLFKTNLTDEEVHKLDYYLKHVSELPTAQDNGRKIQRTMNLELNTLIDTQRNDAYIISYVLNNPNPFVPKETAFNDSDMVANGAAQIEAKFPGDWIKFLERNLNAQTPADHGAPSGRYTVTVSFLVDVDGTISDVKAMNDPGYGTAEEAIRVIKHGPKWIPAMKDGRNVVYRQKQNIVFQVSGQ
jgi:hypothetical protein